MRYLLTGLSVLLAAVAWSAPASAQQPSQAPAPATQTGTPPASSSPWLVVPVFSSNPKLGTAFGGLGAYLHTFDPDSRVSLFGVTYQYTSTHSQIAAAFARTSFGADHHRLTVVAPFGHIKNDYDDYLGTGQPLKTDDDFQRGGGTIPVSCRRVTGSSARRATRPTTRCLAPRRRTSSSWKRSAYAASSRPRWARS